MTIQIQGNRHENAVHIDESLKCDGFIKIKGIGNQVRIGALRFARRIEIELGSDCEINLADNCIFQNLQIFCKARSRVNVGEACTFNGTVRLLSHEPTSIDIGEDCLFAGGITVTTSDMHPIYLESSSDRINPAADVVIGSRVWIGMNVLVLKGSVVGEGSVVGAASVVTGKIPPKSLVAGNPSRLIRSGVRWERQFPTG